MSVFDSTLLLTSDESEPQRARRKMKGLICARSIASQVSYHNKLVAICDVRLGLVVYARYIVRDLSWCTSLAHVTRGNITLHLCFLSQVVERLLQSTIKLWKFIQPLQGLLKGWLLFLEIRHMELSVQVQTHNSAPRWDKNKSLCPSLNLLGECFLYLCYMVPFVFVYSETTPLDKELYKSFLLTNVLYSFYYEKLNGLICQVIYNFFFSI